MKIKQTYIGFTNVVDVGRYGFFIDVDTYGVESDIKDLINQAAHFSRIILVNKPLEQKDEVAKFVRRCTTLNSDITIEINTCGLIKPVGIISYDNVVYNVNLQLKNSGLEYNKRINAGVINWFNEADANFKFDVKTVDDIDEISLLVNNFGIKKKQVFIALDKIEDELIKQIKSYGYNIVLWRNENE